MLLFLCESNSVRSPMAQAIAEHLVPNIWVDSAGAYSSYIRPMVATVLEQDGIHSRHLRSKDLFGVELDEATHVIALCDPDELPRLPKRLAIAYWGIPDPLCVPVAERQEAFEECRDTLISRIRAWIKGQPILPYIPPR